MPEQYRHLETANQVDQLATSFDRHLRPLVVHAEVMEGGGAGDLRRAPRLLQPNRCNLRARELVRAAPAVGRDGDMHLDASPRQRGEGACARALDVVRMGAERKDDVA